MSKFSDNYVLTEQVLIRLKKIKDGEDICCPALRDDQLKSVYKKLKEIFGVNLEGDDAMVGYEQLRNILIEDNDLSASQKINLIKKM